MRHQIQHRVGQDSLLDSRESNKWTISEYHLFMDLAFGDEKVFNKSWITPAFESTEEYRGISGLLNANFIEVIRILLNILSNYYHIILIQLILLLLLLKNMSTSINQKISITLASWAPVLAALYFTVATLHAPERSIYPILILPSIIVFTLVIILGSKIKDARGSTTFYLIGAFIFLLLLFPDKGIINEVKTNDKNIKSAIILSSELIKFDDQAIFIGHGNTEFSNFSNPYVNPAQWDSPKVVTVGSWDTFSPHWYKRNQFVGIEQKSVYEALFTKDIYWLSNSLPDTSYMVELFLKENGFPETNRQNVAMFPEGQMLYKFLPQ
jgi:FtsH-binding integral membrane protein